MLKSLVLNKIRVRRVRVMQVRNASEQVGTGGRRVRTTCALVSAFALIAALPAIAQQQGAPAPAGPPGGKVLIVQESNGFPGGEQATELARQQVIVIGDRLRVLDTQHDWALFVSLPERVVREGAISPGEYVERPFSYYEKYRTDRAKALADQAAEFRRQRERLDGKDAEVRALEAEYARMGGDPKNPGAIAARLEPFPNDTRKVKVVVDRQEREVTLEHFKIRENNASEPVFDLWITRDLALPVDVLAFWRALGTFAPEVSAKLQQVPGVVLECTAFLDTGTFKKRFQSRVLELRTDDVALTAESVSVPARWKKVAAPAAVPANAAPDVWCVMTGRPLRAGSGLVFIAPDGKRYHVADAQQRVALIKLLSDKKEPPFLRGPAPASSGSQGGR
jgi:hypothetical protein